MLKEGELCWVPKDKFEVFLQKHISEDPQFQMKKVAQACFGNQTDAVILFINVKQGTFKCECYLPIFDNDDTLEQYGTNLGDIDGCICLGPLVVENIQKIRNKEELASLKDLARCAGYWHGEYAAVVFR